MTRWARAATPWLLSGGSRVKKLRRWGAIFVNATGADTLDWEDCSWTGHPTVGFIPVAFSVSETMKKSGKDYLTAVIGGFELYQRIAGYIRPPQDWNLGQKGWGLVTWQIFAASMPAGKLMECNPEQFNLLLFGRILLQQIWAAQIIFSWDRLSQGKQWLWGAYIVLYMPQNI